MGSCFINANFLSANFVRFLNKYQNPVSAVLTSLTRTHLTLGAIYNYKLNLAGGSGFRLNDPAGISCANVGALDVVGLTANGPAACRVVFGRTSGLFGFAGD